MYGMLFSIKSFVTKISPLDVSKGFICYKTSKYALHYLETPTGLKFVLNTDIYAQNVRDFLQQLYTQVRPQIFFRIYHFNCKDKICLKILIISKIVVNLIKQNLLSRAFKVK